MEFEELQSGHRRLVSVLIMLTPFHCPANPGDKEQGIWWDSLLAILGSSCLDYFKHPDWASSSLVSIWVRISCVITSPWSERGAPYKVTYYLCSNSDSTHNEISNSKKFVKIICDTIFFCFLIVPQNIFTNFFESLLSLRVLSLLLQILQVTLWGAPFSLQGEVITQLVLTHVETRLDEAQSGCLK